MIDEIFENCRKVSEEESKEVKEATYEDDEGFSIYVEAPGDKEYLELHDNHTLWKIKKEYEDDREFENKYLQLVDEAVRIFEDKTGVQLLLLGRMGRHVCVDNIEENRKRYDDLKKTALELEKWLIDQLNESKQIIGEKKDES